jgi:hypothetical protein
MIKVEISDTKDLTGGIMDAEAVISIVGELPVVALELANLLTAVSDKYPMVMDIALKMVKDNNELRKKVDND